MRESADREYGFRLSLRSAGMTEARFNGEDMLVSAPLLVAEIGEACLSVTVADITTLKVDAIVTAATRLVPQLTPFH